ncbi:uncharacterized protein LOC141537919 [Cotesia typhae]|uniref:uncharacterized protein LOC141537919 n=1 Tax=Cotesia typhae TaxID=2053667 RepID=UPI003D6952F1
MSSSDDNGSSPPRKKYKLYNLNASHPIPLRTLYRINEKKARTDEKQLLIHSNNSAVSQNLNIYDNYENCLGADIFSENDISSDSGSSSEDHENSSNNSNNNQSASDTELDNYLSDHDDDDNIYSDNDHETISQINDNEISNLNTERGSLLMLHENSSISVDQCVFDLLDYYIKHNISKSALAETLKMQLNILPQDNKMPKSVYKLFQYVHKIATPCLWLDKDLKPPMNIFLKPLSLKIQNAFESGIDWIDPETKERMTSKIVAPLFIADAPARQRKKRVRIYPADSNARLRDGERMIKQVEQLRAFQQQVPHLRKTHVRGVVGESILCTLPLLNLGTCLVPEYMHSVLLGVVKQLFNIYTNKSGPWSIKNSMSEINDFITNIRPPAYFNRLPRSLAQITYFKASEYYNLILFYALPALRDYLPQRYLQHLLTLIIALFNLLQNEITEDDLQEAESLLEIFINEVPILFSDRELTYNMHQLKHLVLCVRRWGPLQSTSAFCFENYNGYIASSVHGNKNMSQEIVNNVTIAQGICILKNRVASQNNDILETNSSTNYELLDGIDLKSTNFYTRAKINCDIYTSNFYKETKINSSNVKIKMNNYLESISQVIKVGDYICKRPNLWKQVW